VVDPPETYTIAAEVRYRGLGAPHTAAPSCAGAPPFVRMSAVSLGGEAAVSCGALTLAVCYTGRGYFTLPMPETVQNPTEEMLLELLR